ncbi:SMP-30/gluconolactonase/LRE family protein, partial [Rhizobium ruizarguesonis]
ITVYSREIAQEMKRATQLEQALRNSIISDAIDVHFQPIVSLSNNQVASGKVTKIFNGISIPNSICFSPDGKIGYYTDSRINRL